MSRELRESVRTRLVEAIGESKVLWKEADLVPYTKDTFRIHFRDDYRYFPDFAVLPETTEEVQAVVKIAADHRIPMIPKGGGSNRTGMLVPVHGGIVIDTIKMNKVLEINVPNLYVTTQTGISLKELEERLAEHGLALNQEQGSFRVATVGGSISTAGFSRKHQKYGTISDRVMSLEVVLADGSILRTGPKVLYTSTGYRLHQLFIGAEGTLGMITEATLRVEPLPEAKDLLLAFYDDFWAANEAAQRVMASCVTFTGGEAYGVDDASEWGGPKEKKGLFYVGLEGTEGEVAAEKAFIKNIMEQTGGVLAKQEDAQRFFGKYTFQWCGARTRTGFEDALTTYIPMERMTEFYDKLWNDIMPRHGTGPLPGEKYSLDVGRYRISAGRFYIKEGEKGYEEYRGVLREVAALATSLGGSISSCHGVGIEHRDNLELEFTPVTLDVMRLIKKVLDPDNIMNPGKKLPDNEG
ncbi:MAG TPA: FAD-binding oxidoreductase [Thermoplasmata archaeon]